ncbi:MAG TPA: hypothetical protein ENN84_10090 [Candidatus Marinimicrobia bacterium]|nr:hypothetical protein [Candidatus Neomarinimicrobiota bacterium]
MTKSALTLIMISFALSACASIAQQAQEQKAGVKTDETLSELTQRLKLSLEDAEKLRPIIREGIILENEAWSEFGQTPLLSGKITAVYAVIDAQIEALLSPEQILEYSRYKRYRAQQVREEIRQYQKMQRQLQENQR